MSNVNNITSKILKDAEVRKESILKAAEEEKNKILSKKAASAKELEAEILAKAEVEAKAKKERILSGAKLKVRNDKLAAKQEVIDSVFKASIEKLNALGQKEFLDFLKSSICALDIEGDETLQLNAQGLGFIDDKFMLEINSSLKSKGLKGEIKLNQTAGDFSGGFILEKNGVEINNTFESLVESLRDELELDIAKVLFN